MIRTLYKLIILLLLVNTGINIYGQQSVFKRSDLFSSIENIRLFSDRKIYCVNEDIFFTAEYSYIKELDTLDWSKVLYVELIRWNGVKLAQSKFELNKPGISGNLKIPGNLPSGNYYLRAYTKWMRNFSVNEYPCLLVKIINPFNTRIDEGPSESEFAENSVLPFTQKSVKDITCSMVKSVYNTREKVEVSFNITENNFFNFNRFYIIVAKSEAVDTSFIINRMLSQIEENNISNLEYLPEIRGITVSGKIIDNITKLPKSDILVSLSDPVNGQYFFVDRTNSKGRFIFSLPYLKGKYDFYIQTETLDSLSSEILIDNSFCDKPVKLPYIPFKINDNESELVKNMIINIQINEKFFNNDTSPTKSIKEEALAFYGSKKAVYYTEKYIELPNVEEFIFEIVKEANIKYEKGNSSAINNGNTSFSGYPPLLLLDNIVFNNNDKLLKIPLNRIERVEIINKGYMVGNMRYNGIISIYSKNKDYAGIKMNKNGFFFTYDFISATDSFQYLYPKQNNPRIPDRRNILYWDPDFEFTTGQKKTITFYTSDNKGNYIIYIRSKKSIDNSEIYGTCYFTVN